VTTKDELQVEYLHLFHVSVNLANSQNKKSTQTLRVLQWHWHRKTPIKWRLEPTSTVPTIPHHNDKTL